LTHGRRMAPTRSGRHSWLARSGCSMSWRTTMVSVASPRDAAAGAVAAARLDARSRDLRHLIVRAMEKGGRGHLASAASVVEILRVLYDDVLHVRPAEPDWPDRDRCILSKGHGCLALYAVLAEHGFFPVEELDRFCHFDGLLGG